MKFIIAALPIALVAGTSVASPDADAIVKAVTSPRFLQRNSRKLMVSEQCTSEIEALFGDQDFVDAVVDFESSLMGKCEGAVSMTQSDNSMDIGLDLASCDTTALDQACIVAGGKLITIQAADLTCSAEGVEVTVSIKEYTDCGGMSCPDVFDPSEIQPELIKELEKQNGVTCEITAGDSGSGGGDGTTTPPSDDTTSGSGRVMSWTISGVASALVATHLPSMML
mmetsp:Transcript_16786/g.27906  ORF Transcript_16786/g.27906 Transcript_16786/m.27906 type:complete len:225 (-) Transcript_16786:1056-1730(-)